MEKSTEDLSNYISIPEQVYLILDKSFNMCSCDKKQGPLKLEESAACRTAPRLLQKLFVKVSIHPVYSLHKQKPSKRWIGKANWRPYWQEQAQPFESGKWMYSKVEAPLAITWPILTWNQELACWSERVVQFVMFLWSIITRKLRGFDKRQQKRRWRL